MPLCLLKIVGFAALASLFLLHIFLSLFGKKGGDTSKYTFFLSVKFYVDVDILKKSISLSLGDPRLDLR